EAMDNVNWYYFADQLPLLRCSLQFDHVLALALIGLWLERANAGRHRILCYFLVAAAGSLMYSTVIGRYRLPAVAVLLVYAAVTLDWAARQIATRRWRPLAVAGVAALGIAMVSANLLPTAEREERYRPGEFSVSARGYYDRGETGRAFDELRAGLETAYAGPDRLALSP